MSDDIPQTQRRALTKLIERSATDPNLRERLLTNPHATLEEEIGFTPEEPIRFVESEGESETRGESDIRIIVLPQADDTALSEDQLEAVSGGTLDFDTGEIFKSNSEEKEE